LTPPTSAGGAWKEKILYNFQNGNDGSAPAGISPGPDGVLYGATSYSPDGGGTVFKLIP
jgi:hypothetical protein